MYEDLFACRNKVALVAGGAGLLGGEIAKGLHAWGAAVHLADIDPAKAAAIVKDTEIKYVELDVTAEDSVKAAADAVIRQAGRIDIFVYAAYPKTRDWGRKFEQIAFDSWKENVNAQLGGFFLCCKVVAEHMKRQGGGSIICLASIYGVVAPDFSLYEGTSMTMPAAYAAIKGGIIAFAKYLATYYAQDKIRVNSVSPGGVLAGQPESFVERYEKRTPLGRMAGPADVVGGVIYLASDASSYVTGHNLIIDGGWTAW